MIAKLITVEHNNYVLNIKELDINYSVFKSLIPFNDDNDIINILNKILEELDCSVEINNIRLITTNNFTYKDYISKYYYYLYHLDNQILYNTMLDKLINKHIINIEFENNNPITPIKVNKKIGTKRQSSKGMYVKQISTDMFTGKEQYVYYNTISKKSVISDNPDLLDNLNGVKPKKEKRTKYNKSNGVPISSMTFSFKKKD